MKIKCLIGIILLLSTIIMTVGCALSPAGSTDTTAPSDTTSSVTGNDTKPQETMPDPGTGIEPVDYSSEGPFVVLNLDNTITTNYPYAEVFSEGTTGVLINDAVFKRNLQLTKKYNIDITSFMAGERDAVSQALLKTNESGDAEYDLVMQTLSHSVSLAINGAVYEFSNLNNVNLENDWWFSDSLEQLTIGNKVFFAPSHANICFMSATMIIYFNKTIVENYKLESPYDLVRSGDWTWEKIKEMCTDVTNEVNNDGKLGEGDMVGFAVHPGTWAPIFTSQGGMLISKDSDDFPIFEANEKDIDLMSDIVTSAFNSSIMYTANYTTVEKEFIFGNVLYMLQSAYQLPIIRAQMEDFGLLPLPKYDKAQTEYISNAHQDWASVMLVPSSQPQEKLEMISNIMEDMAYYSYKIIKPEYYNVMLQGRYAMDEQSAGMLDTIFDNITFDLALVFKKSGITIDAQMRTALGTGIINVSSMLDSQKRSINSTLKSIVDSYKKYAQ